VVALSTSLLSGRPRGLLPEIRSAASAGANRAHERVLADMICDMRRVVLCPPATKERCYAIFLDHNRTIAGEAALGSGDEAAVRLRLRDVFAAAFACGANSMILAHNHPSGDCTPSLGDIATTKRLASVANTLEIELIDHLIFTQSAVFSMRRGSEL